MKPYQKLVNENGNEVILYPLEYLVVSRGDHDGHAFDVLGWNAEGRVFNCPCYAPFSGVVHSTGNDHNMIFWSADKVQFADGTIDYASVLVAHSETPPGSVGTTYSQGDLWYHTGNYGISTGDHLHIEIAKGHVSWNDSGTGLNNSLSLNNGVYVNDTVIVNGGSYDWITYDAASPVPKTIKSKFKWVLYSQKIRKKY